MRCKFYDCGWCYAPTGVENNSSNGACVKPFECPTYLNPKPIESPKKDNN